MRIKNIHRNPLHLTLDGKRVVVPPNTEGECDADCGESSVQLGFAEEVDAPQPAAVTKKPSEVKKPAPRKTTKKKASAKRATSRRPQETKAARKTQDALEKALQ